MPALLLKAGSQFIGNWPKYLSLSGGSALRSGFSGILGGEISAAMVVDIIFWGSPAGVPINRADTWVRPHKNCLIFLEKYLGYYLGKLAQIKANGLPNGLKGGKDAPDEAGSAGVVHRLPAFAVAGRRQVGAPGRGNGLSNRNW